MLNAVIAGCTLTGLILVAIWFGFLGLAANVSSLLTLFVIGYAAWCYRAKRPLVRYEIANKEVARDDSDYLYQCWLAFKTDKGAALVKGFYINTDSDVIPEPGPGNTARFEPQLLLQSGLGVSVRIGQPDFPTFAKTGSVSPVQFRCKEQRDKFRLRMVLDSTLDPMQQGFSSVFHGLYAYRLFAEVSLDFSERKRQEGQFKPYHF